MGLLRAPASLVGLPARPRCDRMLSTGAFEVALDGKMSLTGTPVPILELLVQPCPHIGY